MASDRTWERSLAARDGGVGALVPGVDPFLACIEIHRDGLTCALGSPHYSDAFLDGIRPMHV